jgi:ABC-type glycerol-3-phosphate transport system substrate-binding protein
MSQRLRLFLLVLLLTSVLGVTSTVLAQDTSICGSEPVTFNFLNFWGDAREALMNDVIAKFNELCPNITINNNVQGFDGRAELVASTVASSSPPGLIMTTRIETYQFAQRGLIIPISDYVGASGVNVDDLFYPGEIGNQYYDDKLWT